MLHLLPVEEQKKAFERFVYESGQAASEIGFWLFDRRKAAAVDESKVTCPVLVIGAAEDRITPASVVRKVVWALGSKLHYTLCFWTQGRAFRHKGKN